MNIIEFINVSYFILRIYLFIFTRYFQQDLSIPLIARKSLVLFYALYNLLRMHIFFLPSNPNYPRLISFASVRIFDTVRLINPSLSFFVVITKRAACFTNRRDASLSFMTSITAGIVSRTGNDGVTPMARTRVHAPTIHERNRISMLHACNPLHVSRYTPHAYTYTYAHHQADECTWRRDKTQSTRKTRPTRLFTDFYRLPIATNRFGGIPVVPFYLRTDPLVQVTSLSRYDFVHFSSVEIVRES